MTIDGVNYRVLELKSNGTLTMDQLMIDEEAVQYLVSLIVLIAKFTHNVNEWQGLHREMDFLSLLQLTQSNHFQHVVKVYLVAVY